MRVRSALLTLTFAVCVACAAAACTLPAGDPCCAGDGDCAAGAVCFESRCALRCDDDAQCAEGETCIEARVCARLVRGDNTCAGDAP